MNTKIARNLSLKQFRAFVAVARCGSFSRAAQELAVSQPALSLSIQQFEEVIGVSLLKRTTRLVELTAQGQELLPKAEKILEDVEASVLSVRASAQDQLNQVRVAVLPSAAVRILPPAMRGFAAEMPQAKVHLQDDNARGVEAQVLEGRADFGVSSSWSDDPRLTYLPFLRDQVGLICRNTQELARRTEPLSWDCLDGLPFAGMAKDTGVSRLTMAGKGLPASVTSPDFTVLTMAALAGLIESGEAVSAVPALAAPDYLNPALVYRSLSAPTLYRELQLVVAKDRPLPSAAQSFLEYLQSQARQISARFPNRTVEASVAGG
ncbi:LysR family transcriptional regulator [Leisingera sp. SS27]|uniref:LysR family transcriptional regulator n=1 Tax=Leisingera sp. SS27 TaxID=2979462 RepID=UPI00232FD32F|nr:LysR family transcriptional regulator [Leisingera sp. SS27]MDC0660497.1 LysR family transcriptional regulator [Leisingera sp. SS27]